jgi:hypothetical protein
MPLERFLDLLRQRVNKPRAQAPSAAPGEVGMPAGSMGRVA